MKDKELSKTDDKRIKKQTQLAIAELERVKDFFVLEDEKGNIDITRDIFEVAEYVITKINELKGSKNILESNGYDYIP